ncbi:unnamed protein product, partial [Brenthis ino]
MKCKGKRSTPVSNPGYLNGFNCLGGVVASMYGCTPGGPGFESRVGPSLVIESFCIVSLSNSPELDFLQTMIKIFYWSRWVGIVGLESFVWKIWASLLLSLLLAIEGEAIWKVVTALAGWAIDMAGHRSVTARFAGSLFYASSILGLIQCWRLSSSWEDISKYWASVEWIVNIKCMLPDRTLKKRMYRVVIFVAICSIFEHVMDMVGSFDFQCSGPLCLRKYILKSHGFLLLEFEYSHWIGVPLLFMSIIATIIWNLQDLIIILISMGLTSRYKRLNRCVEIVAAKNNREQNSNTDMEFLKVNTWRKIREAYVKQAMLVRRIDNSLSGIVLISTFFNFYFICLQLFLGITIGFSGVPLKQIYYIVSLVWICIRTGCTVLAAADVNKHSKLALPYLYECQGQFYNIEMERLQKQLSKDYVALTGMGFFSLNRNVILQMAASVMTYVLVLVQYDDTDSSSSNVTKTN